MASLPPRGSSPALLSAGQRLAVSSTSSSPSQSPIRLPPLLGSALSTSPAPARPQQFVQSQSATNASSLPSSSVSHMIAFSPSSALPKSSHSLSSASQGASSSALARRRSSVSGATASSSPPQHVAAPSSAAAPTSSSKSPSRPGIPLLPISLSAPAAKQSVHESLAAAMTVSAAPLSARPQSAASAANSTVSNSHSTSDSATTTPRRDRPRSAHVAAPSSPQSARRRPSPIAPADMARLVNTTVLNSAQDSGGPLSLLPRARSVSDGSRALLVAPPPPFPIGATAPSPASASQATSSRHAAAQSVLTNAIACDFPVSASLSSDSDDLSGSQWTNLLTNYRLHNIKPAGTDSKTPSMAAPRADKAAAAVSNGIAGPSSLSADPEKRVSAAAAAAAAAPITSPTEASDPESESYSFDSFDSPPATESKPAAIAHAVDAVKARAVPKGDTNAPPLSAVSHVTDLSFIPRIETFSPPGQLAPTGAFGGNFESLFAHIKSSAPLASCSIASNHVGAAPAARTTDPRVLELESRLAEAEQRNQLLLAALQHVTSQRDDALLKLSKLVP